MKSGSVNMVDLFGPLKIEENCFMKLADILMTATSLHVRLDFLNILTTA